MPLTTIRCPNGKYRIGNGPHVFESKIDAEKAYRGFLWDKYGSRESRFYGHDIPDNIGLEEAKGFEEQVNFFNKGVEDKKNLFENK